MSQRITKAVADMVSSKLTEHKLKAYQDARKKLGELTTKYMLSRVPKEVLKLWKTQRKYMKSESQICFVGNGFNHMYFYSSEDVPGDGNNRVVPDDKSAKEFKHLNDDVVKKEGEWKGLRQEIKTALITLSTYANIQREFKEAAKYLPSVQSSALAINVDSIRRKLGGG